LVVSYPSDRSTLEGFAGKEKGILVDARQSLFGAFWMLQGPKEEESCDE